MCIKETVRYRPSGPLLVPHILYWNQDKLFNGCLKIFGENRPYAWLGSDILSALKIKLTIYSSSQFIQRTYKIFRHKFYKKIIFEIMRYCPCSGLSRLTLLKLLRKIYFRNLIYTFKGNKGFPNTLSPCIFLKLKPFILYICSRRVP